MFEIASVFAKSIFERGYDALVQHKDFHLLVAAIKEQL